MKGGLMFYYLSRTHLLAAAMATSQAFEYEDKSEIQNVIIVGRYEEDKHSACVISSIISIVAYLEAMINEIFECIYYEEESVLAESIFKNVSRSDRKRLHDIWKHNRDLISKLSIFDKYDFLIVFVCGNKLDTGKSLVQSIKLVIKLRNYFVHYYPELTSDTESKKKTSEKLSSQLRGKFALNSSIQCGIKDFPEKFTTYHCSIWALKSACEFVRYFAKEIGWESYGEYDWNIVKSQITQINL